MPTDKVKWTLVTAKAKANVRVEPYNLEDDMPRVRVIVAEHIMREADLREAASFLLYHADLLSGQAPFEESQPIELLRRKLEV
jgi:hypothetical protein